MATQVQNTLAVLNALADSIGKTITSTKALEIVEEFINQVGGAATNEEKATEMNATLVRIILQTGRSHVGQAAEATYDQAIEDATDGAASNF